MARNRENAEDGCLTTEELTISAYRAFTKFEFRLGRAQPEWIDLEDDVRSSWCAMVNEVLVSFDDEEAEVSVKLMADVAHQRFAEGITGELPADFLPWDRLDDVLKEEWKWLIRHIGNMLAYDKEENEGLKPQDHEDKIDDFFRVKLEELGFSIAAPIAPKEPEHGQAIFDAAPAPEPSEPWRAPEPDDDDGPVAGPVAGRGPQPRPTGTLFYGQFTI